MLWWMTLALAGPETLPRQAEVELPAAGVALIPVPASLRATSDPGTGRDLLLLNGRGEPVPFAILRGQTPPDRIAARRGTESSSGPLVTWPDAQPGVYWVKVGDRPLDALSVRIPYDEWSATVTVEQRTDTGLEPVAEGRVWRLGDLESQALDLPATTGTFRVEVRLHGGKALTEAGFVGLRYDTPPLPETVWTLPVQPLLQENGWVRYDLALPLPQPVDWVRPVTDADLFERDADVVATTPYAATPDTLAEELWPRNAGRIRRLDLGGAQVDDLNVPVRAGGEGAMALLIDAQRLPPIDVHAVEIGVTPQVLVVRDPGPGPHVLYGGAVDRSLDGAQLQFAAPELRRAADHRAEPGPVEANPDYVSPEVRSEVAGPGRALDLAGFRHARALDGSGLARVALDTHVLTESRSDLGDLRLVDGEGRQIPFLLRRRSLQEGAQGLATRRKEADGRSILTVELPDGNLPVRQLVLHASAPVFRRQVTVARPRPGRPAQVLRTLQWDAVERPGSLGIALHRPVGDTLEVRIDNGDDPPLPIDAVDVTWEGWELVALLPADGARLMYGDAGRAAPSYDFATMRSLADAPAQVVPLGEPVDVSPPVPGAVERALVYGGIGVLGLGMLVLLGLLVRGGTPPEGEPRPDDGEE